MKVRVAQISALQRDLTLALAAERLRIEAPVPGRPYVGIEVPNARSTIVRLRSILESEALLPGKQSRWRLRWGGMFRASRWWPTWSACPTC